MLLLTEIVLIVVAVGIARHIQTDAAPIDNILDDATDGGTSLGRQEGHFVLEFLSKYGYLQDVVGADGQFQSDEVITSAIKKYQKFIGVPLSGIVDAATTKMMKSLRCGVPDILHSDSSSNTENTPFGYYLMGRRWPTNTVTWNPTSLSAKLRQSDQITSIQEALSMWAAVTPLNFQRTQQQQPDIEIKFARAEHGDGAGNQFDGRSGVLAHAFGPGGGLGGDVHFDEDEAWTIATGEGIDLTTVAAHEFGHALGLAHSSVPDALMAPSYKYKLGLHDDDIQGIQTIYGSRPTQPSPRMSTTLRTVAPTSTTIATTTRTRATTTTRTTTTRSRNNNNSTQTWTPSYCDVTFKLDAISQGPDGLLYAFRDDLVYKLNGQGLESGYPKLISQVFSQAPRMSVNTVTFVPETRKTFIFKGHQVWRYSNFTLDEGYPKIWTQNSIYVPSAALTLTYRERSQIFMFGSDNFWEWNPQTEKLVPGYPLSLQTYFPHAQRLPDAAFMNQQGHFFFFKNNSYKKLEHRGRDAELKALGSNLLDQPVEASQIY